MYFRTKIVQKACKIRARKRKHDPKNDTIMAKMTLYLDKRGKKPDEAAPLKLVIRHKGQAAMLNLEINLPEKSWDERAQKAKNCLNWRKINEIIDDLRLRSNNALFDMRMAGYMATMTAVEIRDKIKEELWGANVTTDKRLVDVYNIVMGQCRRESTKHGFAMGLRSMKVFDARVENYTCRQITASWVKKWMLHAEQEQGLSQNSRHQYLTRLKTVLNYAVEEGYIDKTPIRTVKVRSQETRKRALTLEQFRALWYYQPRDAREERAIDCFKLSFLLIGANFADMFSLRPPKHGRVEYYRAKTGRLYSIAVEPEAQAFMEKYGTEERAAEFYPGCTKKTVETYLGIYLKDLPLEFDEPLTMYWARHTWATFAAELDIPMDTIAAALGHGARTVTHIYVKRNTEKVDAANRAVIDFALYDKRPQK